MSYIQLRKYLGMWIQKLHEEKTLKAQTRQQQRINLEIAQQKKKRENQGLEERIKIFDNGMKKMLKKFEMNIKALDYKLEKKLKIST